MKREWYFVRRLRPTERKAENEIYEVQVLDSRGRGEHVGRFQSAADELIINGHPISQSVLNAAENCKIGSGQYVDKEGNLLNFLGEKQ